MAVAVWLENSCCERSQKYLIRAKEKWTFLSSEIYLLLQQKTI